MKTNEAADGSNSAKKRHYLPQSSGKAGRKGEEMCVRWMLRYRMRKHVLDGSEMEKLVRTRPCTSQASVQIRCHSEGARNHLQSSDKGATGPKDPLLTRD